MAGGLADLVYDRRNAAGFGLFTILGGDIDLGGNGLEADTTFTGTFDFTVPPCVVPPPVCGGLGTPSFNTGVPGQTPFNIGLDFAGINSPYVPQGLFSVGTLTVRNGETLLGTSPAFPGTTTFVADLHIRELLNGGLVDEGDFFLAYYDLQARISELEERARGVSRGRPHDQPRPCPPIDARYGKVWLTPYHTGKSPAQAHPLGEVWYDELIVSASAIPFPGTPRGTAPGRADLVQQFWNLVPPDLQLQLEALSSLPLAPGSRRAGRGPGRRVRSAGCLSPDTPFVLARLNGWGVDGCREAINLAPR